ncbi:MAG: maleylacetoacetate isomerase [Alphaproteobacteria bacterium]|nr:maleylacetoacetate isomerase [Alphaproteobacteria bacterium]MBV9061689.1 maleylacetoacetate isomerase [Alphaproteobacteria bacterium]
MAAELTLYTYFRSSAAFRVRIALNLKGLTAQHKFVHLLKDGGQQFGADYARLNPQHLVPTLVHNGHPLQQSLAIIEYLDEVFPEPPLLPPDALGRAWVRAIALAVACDIHPVNNLRMRKYLHKELGRSNDEIRDWQVHWISLGFDALETMLAKSESTGRFCHGDVPTLADICLIPQMANARALNMGVEKWPTLALIERAAFALPAFLEALPKNQADAE